MMNKLQSLFIQNKLLFATPFVISAFLLIIACLILLTSAPPTYVLLFISQFETTLSHGFGPFLYTFTYS